MKLYDTFYVEYPLPIPSFLSSKLKELIAYEISAGSFKCHDMYQALRGYEIDKEGNLYELHHSYFENDKLPYKHRMSTTKDVTIYTYVSPFEFDDYNEVSKSFRLEYIVSFQDGKVINIKNILPTQEQINAIQLHRSV